MIKIIYRLLRQRLAMTLLLLFCLLNANAQSFRIEDITSQFGKGKPFKISGGFSANTVLNAGNETQGRDPFAYYLNGNINLNLYGLVNLPFSFNLTNSGTSYKLPSSPNRLSISPSYKWITGHFGDVSMSFSPYTLNGHLFTGAGVELKPDGWELSAMYGRLLRAVEYDELHPEILPTYKRMAYGVKAGRTGEKYEISVNLLNAKDIASSLAVPPDSLGITPMKNAAGSVVLMYKPVEVIKITGEYGLSFLTQDRRAVDTEARYHAFKAHIDLIGKTNSIGVGYERIDPNYRTLGAYYFVNDIENITLNGSQSFWKEKIRLDLSVGYEHDDLDKNKANASSRVVSSANLAVNFSENLTANLSYSNFQSYTNVRSNFELINKENPLDLLDTLNFVQLSQNANIAVGILTKKNETRQDNLNLNLSYQDAADKQGGIYRPGSVTEMVNASAGYSINFTQSNLMFNGLLNLNNSKIQSANALTWGPTLEVAFPLFKKKINMKTSASYNAGLLEGIKQNDVFLFRLNSSYILMKKHNFSVAYSFRWRSAIDRPSMNNSLITAGYSYNF